MTENERGKLVYNFLDYVPVSAWLYQDMSGLDRNKVEHKLLLK